MLWVECRKLPIILFYIVQDAKQVKEIYIKAMLGDTNIMLYFTSVAFRYKAVYGTVSQKAPRVCGEVRQSDKHSWLDKSSSTGESGLWM